MGEDKMSYCHECRQAYPQGTHVHISPIVRLTSENGELKVQNDPPSDTATLSNPSSDSPRVHSTGAPLVAILEERGSRYGDFNHNSHISQQLKIAVVEHGHRLDSLHREALDMILHKVARILAGDPNYADSWVDIAGYATLVVERLPK